MRSSPSFPAASLDPIDDRFIVCVDHGAAALARSVSATAPLAAVHGARVIPVDTAEPGRLRDGSGINSAFEFSGYQSGLERVFAHGRRAGHLTIAFVNGTAFTSHLRLMARYALRRAFGAPRPPDGLRFGGFRHRCDDAKRAVASHGYYLATFAFWLRGTADAMSRAQLYDSAAVGKLALASRYAHAGADYSQLVERWLSPTSFGRGWYQSLPGATLDARTLYRKRLSIYLEHDLPSWLQANGFEVELPPAGSSRALMAVDRLYVNALKLRSRLNRLVGARRPS